MHEKSFGFKEINSFSSWWPRISLCLPNTDFNFSQAKSGSSILDMWNRKISRDWHPNQSTSFITSICPFNFLIIINGFCFFPSGYPEESLTSQKIIHTRFLWEIVRSCKYNITRGGQTIKELLKEHKLTIWMQRAWKIMRV